MSPYSWVIYSLTQPQVANQQKKYNKSKLSSKNPQLSTVKITNFVKIASFAHVCIEG